MHSFFVAFLSFIVWSAAWTRPTHAVSCSQTSCSRVSDSKVTTFVVPANSSRAKYGDSVLINYLLNSNTYYPYRMAASAVNFTKPIKAKYFRVSNATAQVSGVAVDKQLLFFSIAQEGSAGIKNILYETSTPANLMQTQYNSSLDGQWFVYVENRDKTNKATIASLSLEFEYGCDTNEVFVQTTTQFQCTCVAPNYVSAGVCRKHTPTPTPVPVVVADPKDFFPDWFLSNFSNNSTVTVKLLKADASAQNHWYFEVQLPAIAGKPSADVKLEIIPTYSTADPSLVVSPNVVQWVGGDVNPAQVNVSSGLTAGGRKHVNAETFVGYTTLNFTSTDPRFKRVIDISLVSDLPPIPPPATPPPPPRSPVNEQKRKKDRKIGIGVGVGVGGFLVLTSIAIGIYLIYALKKRKQRQVTAEEVRNQWRMASMLPRWEIEGVECGPSSDAGPSGCGPSGFGPSDIADVRKKDSKMDYKEYNGYNAYNSGLNDFNVFDRPPPPPTPISFSTANLQLEHIIVDPVSQTVPTDKSFRPLQIWD